MRTRWSGDGFSRSLPWPWRTLALVVLLHLSVLPAAADQPAESTTLRVAVYSDVGTGASTKNVLDVLQAEPAFEVEKIMAEEIQKGELSEYDVVVFPGGSGSKQAGQLGEEGREQVRDFIRDGGGYIGICAGSYLATNFYDWSLGVLDAKVVDREHWARGTGIVEIKMTDLGTDVLRSPDSSLDIYYGQGPLLAPNDDAETPDYECLAVYVGEIAKKGAPKGVMPGTTAIALGRYGEGHVFCFSPHPEKTEGRHDFVLNAVKWARGGAKSGATTSVESKKSLGD